MAEESVNGLDLFSGIGGLTKALEGYVWPIAYCENNRHAQSVLLQRIVRGDIPPAPIWDDVRTLHKRAMLPDGIDIIYGGFPCQDISVAGRGAGLEGQRSGLYFQITRLVGEIRPRFVFLENVPAVTTRGGLRIVAELSALRYDCRWGILSAADVGANHRRDRWWLLAHTSSRGKGSISKRRRQERERASNINGSSQDVENSTLIGCRQEGTRESLASSENVANTDRLCGTATRRTWSGWPEFGNGGWWQSEPDVGRVANGVPLWVDRLRGLGNAVVPAQVREAFERLMWIK